MSASRAQRDERSASSLERVLVIALATALGVSGCGSDSEPVSTRPTSTHPSASSVEGERPSPEHADRARGEHAADERLEPPVSDVDYAAPASGERFPALSIGQWARYGVHWRDGQRSTMEYRVLDRERGGWWLGIRDQRGRRAQQTRLLVVRQPDGSMGLLAVESLDPRTGRTEAVPHRVVPAIEERMRSVLDLLEPTPDNDAPRTDVSVPAGTFHGAELIERDMELGRQRVEVGIIRHPVVPILGVVRYADRNEEHRFELLAFGSDDQNAADQNAADQNAADQNAADQSASD